MKNIVVPAPCQARKKSIVQAYARQLGSRFIAKKNYVSRMFIDF